jgi:hypothetical protein
MVHTQVSGEQRLQKVIYIIWNIWKERCRKVFDNRAMQAHHLLQELINDDVKQWFLAWKSSAELTE